MPGRAARAIQHRMLLTLMSYARPRRVQFESRDHSNGCGPPLPLRQEFPGRRRSGCFGDEMDATERDSGPSGPICAH